MNEFIEKLIGRLEDSEKEYTTAYGMIDIHIREVFVKIRKIVNKLAEEYKGGWISCSDRLPEDMQKCLTTAKIYFVPDHVDEPDNYIGVELNTYSKQYGWLHNRNVIAWMPLPESYKTGE